MNERIKKLIEQSGLDYYDLWEKDRKAVNELVYLIVQECIQAIEDATPKITSGDHGRGLQLGYDRALLVLKNRFGDEGIL
jgi:hypothetical protein